MELMVQNQNETDMLRDIITTNGANLPANIEDVLEVFEFTDWKAKAWKIMADKMVRLEGQTEAHASALRSGQQWGIAALYAKKRIGEITRDIPKKVVSNLPNPLNHGPSDVQVGKYEALKEQGLYQHSVSEAERIAANPEILEKVIADAKERGDIPNQSSVLREIKNKDIERRAKEGKINSEKPMPHIGEVSHKINERLVTIWQMSKDITPYRDQVSDDIAKSIISNCHDIITLWEG